MKHCCEEKMVALFVYFGFLISSVSFKSLLYAVREPKINKTEKFKCILSKFKPFVALTWKPLFVIRVSIMFSFNYLFKLFFWLSKLSILIIIFCFLWKIWWGNIFKSNVFRCFFKENSVCQADKLNYSHSC